MGGKPRKQARTVSEAYADLGKAIKKLDADHGRVGRHNSRHAVLVKLRRVRALLDQDFPVVAKKRKTPRRLSLTAKDRAFREKMARMRYTKPMSNRLGKRELAEKIGVKVHVSPVKEIWIPLWLDIEYPISQAAAKRLAKDINAQRVLEAQWRLTDGDTGGEW